MIAVQHTDLIPSSEAAQICGVSQGTFNYWAKTGKVPMATTLGNGHRLFDRSEILAFADTLVVTYKLPAEVDA